MVRAALNADDHLIEKLTDDGEYDRIRRWACGTVERMRGQGGSIVPDQPQLAARTKLDRVILGDITVPPQIQAGVLGVLLGGTVIADQRSQPILARVLKQHQALLDQAL